MILLAGGSGRLGTLIVRRLEARGLAVRVLTRDRRRTAHFEHSQVEVVEGDVRDGRTLGAAMVGVSTVVSAIHGFGDIGDVSPASVDRDGNRRLIDAAAAANAGVVLMSIVGASATHPIELFRMKHAGRGIPSWERRAVDDRARNRLCRILARSARPDSSNLWSARHIRPRRQSDQFCVGLRCRCPRGAGPGRSVNTWRDV